MTRPKPDSPERVTYRERLEAALADARVSGQVSARDYESLLADPDCDLAEFERFRVAALQAGVALPEEESDEPEPGSASGPDDRRGPERDLLDRYLSEIGRIPLLAHDDLLAVARRSRAGDEQARKRVILANLRLVVHVARAYRNRGLPMLDLIEEGNLGLIQAVDRFDPERGLRFSTYASIWIRQSILRSVAEQARAVRIPVQMFQQVNRYVRAERALRAAFGREPTPDEVGRELRITPLRAQRLAGLLAGLRSLDEGSSMEAFEQLSTEDLGQAPDSVERLVDLQIEHEKVDRLLRSLSTREEQVLRIRYGFYDGEARTLAQTGEHFGISRERVRQIEARALEKLRKAIDLGSVDRAPGTTLH